MKAQLLKVNVLLLLLFASAAAYAQCNFTIATAATNN
jgi:hypothetical protein